MYKSTDKICDLMSHEEDAIQIISRFGLEMGVGEQTIEQVCEAHDVDTPTFLAIVNYKVFHQRVLPDEIDVPTLQRYLQNAVSSLYWTVGVATSYGEISSGDYIPLGDGAFLYCLERVKMSNKRMLALWVSANLGVTLDPASIFDVQV